MTVMPSFDDFFRAVHRGRAPFPWQSALAQRVVTDGWPEAIGVPTGLGKTACIDIAVWALAAQADRPPGERTAPTRTWYVVDRRLLVDAAYEHGCHLAALLQTPERLAGDSEVAKEVEGDAARVVLRAMGVRLRGIAALGTETSPLHIARLRGAAELGQRSPDPSQPAVIFATVSMFASRLLFRGYGSSRSMRPVDAALAGIDSLILLDEAHISRPLMTMCASAAQCDVGNPTALLPLARARPRLVALTASGERSGDRFDLGPADLACDIVRERIRAPKPTTLVATTRKDLVRDLAREALARHDARPLDAGVVFCNTVATARGVLDELTTRLSGSGAADLVLLTGRMRTREASASIQRVLDRETGAPSDRSRELVRPRGLIVVATQTLEVGADLDFDWLVTETPGARALIQRFGRLNRLGRADAPSAAVCHAEGVSAYPPYGDEPANVWLRLQAAAQIGIESASSTAETAQEPTLPLLELDLSPVLITAAVGEPSDTPKRVGELLPAHLWEYAKTSSPEPDEPPVELFFAGFDDDVRRVSVIWRSHLPGRAPAEDTVLAGVLFPRVRSAEAIDLPIAALKEFLGARGIAQVRRLGDDQTSIEPQEIPVNRIRPGDTVVLNVADGGYDQGGWAATATGTVLDVAALDDRILWLDGEAASVTCGESIAGEVPRFLRELRAAAANEDEILRAELEEELKVAITAALDAMPGHPWLTEREWEEYRLAFRNLPKVRLELGSDGSAFLIGFRPVHDTSRPEVRSDAFDDLSFDVESVVLADHLGAAAETATRVSERIGLPAAVGASVDHAARYHDCGKADERFQALLDPGGASGQPLAKSVEAGNRRGGAYLAAGWPRGGRHEALSARLVQSWLERSPGAWDEDLVLHLIAAHHGHGRPLVPGPFADSEGVVAAEVEGETVRVPSDLSVVDWDQPRRFHDVSARFGYWGAALLEAIVRQSDHAVSHATDRSPLEAV
jgi:CRISPR-associated endonuclease/helicase Cas3